MRRCKQILSHGAPAWLETGMSTVHPDELAVRATYALARAQLLRQEAVVVLQLTDAAATLAFGTSAQPTLVSMPSLGLRALSNQFFPDGRLDAQSIELAIERVEDTVMPWHAKLPQPSRLFAQDEAITQWAHWAGMPHSSAPWLLETEAVEELFSRWTALAQGRPASQDPLPTRGVFSAALLVLRECLHHLGFKGITVLPLPTPESRDQKQKRDST